MCNQSNTKIQQLTLLVLKKYISLCEKHHLRYFFTGGALIGVLRHQGFVPWDDDVDVGMPRSDYNKFVRIMEQGNDDGYGICNRDTDFNWHFDMSQFVDLHSDIEIHLAKQTRHAHAWIDVFPLDGLPSNKFKRDLHVQHILLERYLIQIANINVQVDSHRKRPWYESAVINLSRILNLQKFLNTDSLLDQLDATLQKFDYDSSNYVGNLLGRYRANEVVPKSYFGNPKEAKFVDIFVNIPEQSNLLQTHLYGDYMRLPPKEKQVAHNVKIIHSRLEGRS